MSEQVAARQSARAHRDAFLDADAAPELAARQQDAPIWQWSRTPADCWGPANCRCPQHGSSSLFLTCASCPGVGLQVSRARPTAY